MSLWSRFTWPRLLVILSITSPSLAAAQGGRVPRHWIGLSGGMSFVVSFETAGQWALGVNLGARVGARLALGLDGTHGFAVGRGDCVTASGSCGGPNDYTAISAFVAYFLGPGGPMLSLGPVGFRLAQTGASNRDLLGARASVELPLLRRRGNTLSAGFQGSFLPDSGSERITVWHVYIGWRFLP